MKRACIIFAMLLLAHAPPLQAEGEHGGWSFNLFSLEGLTLSDTFTFDADLAERNDLDLPAYFRISVPRDARIERRVIPNPTGGALVGIMFTRAENRTGTDADLLELVQITGARVPIQSDQNGQDQARLRVAAGLARDVAFPRMVEGKEGAEIIDISPITLGELQAVQVIGRHLEPELGPVLLRIVVVPHPEQAESLVIVAKINLALVPVQDSATLDASLSGRLISSFEYR